MATNILDEGEQIDFTAAGTVTSGQLIVAGQMFGVALISGVSGERIPLAVGVRAQLPKMNAATNAFAVGANVHWDATNAVVTASATSNLKIGVATTAALTTDAFAIVKLNGSF
jgi:predicted RecA/RadA family phage recombinase